MMLLLFVYVFILLNTYGYSEEQGNLVQVKGWPVDLNLFNIYNFSSTAVGFYNSQEVVFITQRKNSADAYHDAILAFTKDTGKFVASFDNWFNKDIPSSPHGTYFDNNYDHTSLYLADWVSHTVTKYNTNASKPVTTAVLGNPGTKGTSSTEFDCVADVTTDDIGNIYITVVYSLPIYYANKPLIYSN